MLLVQTCKRRPSDKAQMSPTLSEGQKHFLSCSTLMNDNRDERYDKAVRPLGAEKRPSWAKALTSLLCVVTTHSLPERLTFRNLNAIVHVQHFRNWSWLAVCARKAARFNMTLSSNHCEGITRCKCCKTHINFAQLRRRFWRCQNQKGCGILRNHLKSKGGFHPLLAGLME